jgi:hypothetical protein
VGKNGARRYSFNSEAEGDACDSCNLIVPDNRVAGLKEGGSSPSKSRTQRSSSPVLRSAHPVQAYGPGPGSDSEEDEAEGRQIPPSSGTSPTPSHMSAVSSTGSNRAYPVPNTHQHKLIYVTRHSPEAQSIYSRLRHSCIRTLSSESLPRGSSSGAFSFGDPIAGYTIAYIFRIPDPRARGRRRTYALTALVRDNCRAMAAFVPVTKAFETIASYIITMTDRALERESGVLSRSLAESLLRTPPLGASVPPNEKISPTSPPADRTKSSTSSPISSHRYISDVSSFLVAKKVDPDGYPRMSREVMRPKGLPEIVGREDFYADLHVKFCSILTMLWSKFPG